MANIPEYTVADNEDQLRLVFDATPVAMILSRPDGSFEYVNPAMLDLLGYSVDEIYRKDLIISHPHDLETNRIIRARLRNDPFSPVIIEKRYIHKDGRTIYGLLTMAAQPDEKGNVKRYIAQVIDLTANKQTEESLLLFSILLDHSRDSIFVTNPATAEVVNCNKLAYKSLGYSREELLNLRVIDFSTRVTDMDSWQLMMSKLKVQKNLLVESEHRTREGDSIPVEINISYVHLGDNEYTVAIVRDISKRKQTEKLIWTQANFDPLTNLPNRRLFKDRLEQTIRDSEREGALFALLYLDLDRFKEVNDSLGHSKGDQLLVETTQRLKLCIRESDTLARLGGDEFTIILRGMEHQDHACQVANKILSALSEPFQLDDNQAYISASIGITFFPDDAIDSENLLKCADQAMYAAKEQGRNGYHFFSRDLQQAAQFRLSLIRDLHRALANNQFQLAYQPIVDLQSGQIFKAEALLRWHHPERGLVSPAEFIPLAEETGLICRIGDWVFRQASEQALQWRQTLDADFRISINTSPVQYHDNQHRMDLWIPWMQQIGLPGEAVSVEITESVLIDSHNDVAKQLLAFQRAGIDVSLDDFGTGYSSLAYLKKLDIDYLKIDQSFVRNLADEGNDRVLCEAIIAMAQKLGLKVIAEGIETPEQQQILTDAGCDFGQGYLFSKPIYADEFELMLMDQTEY